MQPEKLEISWDDLNARRVDTRLREQSAMERTRAYAQMQEESLPQATDTPSSFRENAILVAGIFGLVGGLLAWGAWALLAGPLSPLLNSALHYQPDARADAEKRQAEIQQIEIHRDTGQYDEAQARSAIDDIRAETSKNPYFVAMTNPALTDASRARILDELQARDRFSQFTISVASYAACGMMIAMCLAMAEPLTARKRKMAILGALAGAMAGLAGGIAAALLHERITALADSITVGQQGWVRQLTTYAAIWGTLGMFLGLGSGLAMMSLKKSVIGLGGGLLGGLIGGALFVPIQNLCHNPNDARLVALVAIGLIAGLSTGYLENAIKAGWLKVTNGIIAGKQFILYRNPTYIGSSPDSQIYLFKDPQVGRRHAAIHLLKTGIEIENLPLGGSTLINGRPVSRMKLKNGDIIQIGSTTFRFQEKRPTAGV